ncbi:MAG: OadG family protein [Clostridia bacterium]|nr:OadG family protein [Clostridia bacterium]
MDLLLTAGEGVTVGEVLIDAVIGFAVVFLGISILVGAISLVGLILKRAEEKKQSKRAEVAPPVSQVEQVKDEEDDEELIAVITAALQAYYGETKSKCEFTVRQIKRI